MDAFTCQSIRCLVQTSVSFLLMDIWWQNLFFVLLLRTVRRATLPALSNSISFSCNRFSEFWQMLENKLVWAPFILQRCHVCQYPFRYVVSSAPAPNRGLLWELWACKTELQIHFVVNSKGQNCPEKHCFQNNIAIPELSIASKCEGWLQKITSAC